MNEDALEKVRKMARGCTDKGSLLDMRTNCIAKKNVEAIDIVEDELDTRFPNWETTDVARLRGGGTVSTIGRFRSNTQKFPSQIEAYIWLVNQFAGSNENIFKSHGETGDSYLRLLFGNREGGAMHFAPMEHLLDKKVGNVTGNDSRPVQLECGWWANTILSGTQKIRLLERLSQHCGIKSDEWSWAPETKSTSLQNEIAQRARGKALLDELERQK